MGNIGRDTARTHDMHDERTLAELNRRYDEIYDTCGRPLEQNHNGEYVAISPRGELAIGPTMHEVAQRAAQQFGPGSFLFKIGDRAVGRWR